MTAIDLILAGTLICTQAGVIDGDTFTSANCGRIRVFGIDAPERSTPEGPAAARALSNLITGQTLICERKGKSYDRTVAQCFVGYRDIGAEMVRSGQARDCPRYSHGLYAPLEQQSPAVLTARAGKVKC